MTTHDRATHTSDEGTRTSARATGAMDEGVHALPGLQGADFPTVATGGDADLPRRLARTDAGTRARVLLQLQRTHGNDRVQRMIQPIGTSLRSEARANPVLQRDGPMPPAQIKGSQQGAADIGRGIAAAETRAQADLTTHSNRVKDAISDFRDHATGQIDGMEGDPSDYWQMVPLLVGAVASGIAVLFPPVSIGAVIVTALAAATQGSMSADVKAERADAKSQAKTAMLTFAQKADAARAQAFNKGLDSVDSELNKVSATDVDMLEMLKRGESADLDNVLRKLGIPSRSVSPYGEVRSRLEVEFAAWFTRQQRRSKRSGLENILADIYHKDDKEIAAAQSQARKLVDADMKKRGEPPSQEEVFQP